MKIKCKRCKCKKCIIKVRPKPIITHEGEE